MADTDNLIREVNEEIRRERLLRMWEQYGTYIIAVAVLIVAAAAGYRYWDYSRTHNAGAAVASPTIDKKDGAPGAKEGSAPTGTDKAASTLPAGKTETPAAAVPAKPATEKATEPAKSGNETAPAPASAPGTGDTKASDTKATDAPAAPAVAPVPATPPGAEAKKEN
jgi:hypothetical protein